MGVEKEIVERKSDVVHSGAILFLQLIRTLLRMNEKLVSTSLKQFFSLRLQCCFLRT